MREDSPLRLLVLLALGTAVLVARPTPTRACSVDPDVVEAVRVTDGLEDCLEFEPYYDPGDYDAPTLRIENVCEEPVEIRIPDCRPCYDTSSGRCFDCGTASVVLGGDARSDLVFQLDFSIDDHVGETVETSIEWSRGMVSGATTVEIDMADQHPTARANEACPGFCSVSTDGAPGAFLLVLLVFGTRVRSIHRTD